MEYSIDDLKTSALAKSSSPEKVERVVVFILESENKTDSDNTMSTEEIKKAYQKLKKDNIDIIEIPENTIATTISVLSSKADSRIQCLGRRQGYFITPITESIRVNEGDEDETEKIGKGKLLEKDLYPVLQKWMQLSLNIKGIDISSKRGSEKWRNPDLLGIKEIDFLGNEQFEISTIEVKPNKQDWTMYIFEAVSHSLFSNRTYFAYLKDNFYDKVSDEMKLYASKFGIGIISIAIDDKERGKITTSDKLLKALEDGTCQIKEEVPAPYHIPDIYLQKKFLDGLEIHTKSDLRNMQ
jgi:hypothetical protein